MKKKHIRVALVLILTAACIWTIIANGAEETSISVRMETVSRADVQQTIGISGKLVYRDEQYIFAPLNGRVVHTYVTAGQRVEAGAPLVRLAVDVDAWNQFESYRMEVGAGEGIILGTEKLTGVVQKVIRADTDCTIRQVLINEDALVQMGTPMVRVSANVQNIVCMAAPVDAEKITEGMHGWALYRGERVAAAEVAEVDLEAVDPLTGLRSVRIVLQPKTHVSLSESTLLDIDIILNGSVDVLSLPMDAITERETVWWVNGERCTEIPARIVLADEMRAWVDLPEGIRVAVGEFENGQKVREASE